MYVGIFGDVIFSVGHLRTLTLSNFKGSTGAEWVEHKQINTKIDDTKKALQDEAKETYVI